MKIFRCITFRNIFACVVTFVALFTSVSAWADLTCPQAAALSMKVMAGDQAALQTLNDEAQKGNPYAQTDLGVLHENGDGVAQDYAQAAQWYRKAAEQGDDDAQNNLGLLYKRGQGVTRDYALAAQWFGKAAAQGNADAQRNLDDINLLIKLRKAGVVALCLLLLLILGVALWLLLRRRRSRLGPR